MKAKIQHENLSFDIEFTPEEIGKIIPFFLRSLFNKKVTIIRTSSLLKNKLIELQNKEDWKKFAINQSYLQDDGIALFIQKIPFFIKRGIKNRIINTYVIHNYSESNIFFAIINLFFKYLTKKDIIKILERFKDNDQVLLYNFFEKI